jgi:predicted CxxxxCH...CXXCH cytochrome family protein
VIRHLARAAPALAALAGACNEDRASAPDAPTWRADVAPLVASRCAECHAGTTPAAGWRATSYLDVIGCIANAPAVLPSDERAPILAAVERGVHAGRLDPSERATLAAWVGAGAPAFRGVVHAPGIADPRAPDFHATLLRNAHWAPMLDTNDPRACGRCHEGAPAQPAGIASPAPGATACTSCHSSEGGPLGCATCHGSGARIYPPRDVCLFPADAPRGGAHAAHVDTPHVRGPLACASCHPTPGAGVIGGAHGNGSVEIGFDVGPEASWDRTTQSCAVTCHDRGGARARPTWSDAVPMACGDCHGAPPARHYPGSCTTCHAEANAAGTGLADGQLHMNGIVDVGDGSSGCGACHGEKDSPWPKTGAHAAHRSPTLTTPVDCATCHPVPRELHDAGHLDGVVQVELGGRALDRGAAAAWDGARCTNVACHGAELHDAPSVVPAWRDASGAARACGACHGIPPAQHTASTSCDRATCHGAEITRGLGTLGISAAGKSLHVNGVIDTLR